MNMRKLQVWVESIKLAEDVYRLSQDFPSAETYGMTYQIRKAVVSVASNIAEGSQRTTNRDFAHFILVAKGSLAEVETQLLIACRIGYISNEQWQPLEASIEQLHRKLYAFHSKLLTNHS